MMHFLCLGFAYADCVWKYFAHILFLLWTVADHHMVLWPTNYGQYSCYDTILLHRSYVWFLVQDSAHHVQFVSCLDNSQEMGHLLIPQWHVGNWYMYSSLQSCMDSRLSMITFPGMEITWFMSHTSTECQIINRCASCMLLTWGSWWRWWWSWWR